MPRRRLCSLVLIRRVTSLFPTRILSLHLRPNIPLMLAQMGWGWGAKWELTEKIEESSVLWLEVSAGFGASPSSHHVFSFFLQRIFGCGRSLLWNARHWILSCGLWDLVPWPRDGNPGL